MGERIHQGAPPDPLFPTRTTGRKIREMAPKREFSLPQTDDTGLEFTSERQNGRFASAETAGVAARAAAIEQNGNTSRLRPSPLLNA